MERLAENVVHEALRLQLSLVERVQPLVIDGPDDDPVFSPWKSAVGGPRSSVPIRWVNTILGNVKNALRGTCHAVRPKYAQRCLAEFEYRFNRRFDLPAITPRIIHVALRRPPMPERLLTLRLA